VESQTFDHFRRKLLQTFGYLAPYRRVVPMQASKEQAWPPEAEEDQTEADTEPQPAFRAGPVSAKSSTPESHER
jgi:hypothetical protein